MYWDRYVLGWPKKQGPIHTGGTSTPYCVGWQPNVRMSVCVQVLSQLLYLSRTTQGHQPAAGSCIWAQFELLTQSLSLLVPEYWQLKWPVQAQSGATL